MIGTKSKTAPVETEITTLETALRDASEKVDQIRARRDALSAECVKLQNRRWAMGLEARSELDEAAAAFLDDPLAEIKTDDIDGRIKAIAGELIVVERALGLARERRGEAAKRYANAMAKSLAPAHREAVGKIAAALDALEQANQEEAHIRAQVPGGGSGLPMGAFLPVGSRVHELSPISCWFRYVGAAGLLRED
ncbi:hypothetical protein HH303_18335 [Rhodospirillaceae bacterium KN72]|uniref:Uncharacterized protein n=1 Tax=Pacificispira spongiicola TaxID=2729598 RepID=A0A7Y0E3A6_9PROT|nr:hypothetical protein [Pacificispira spongiicola]NMM46455.1 hypothetical protein [Pacificispira spongiicola]